MYKTLLICLFSVSTCLGQAPPVIILKGIITDAATGEAIPYATIRLSGNSINTMSNENGRFTFKIPIEYRRDSIYISHVGFRPVAILFNATDTGLRRIQLQQEAKQLSEVVIKAVNVLDLIKKAIAKIPDNYPIVPCRYNGFYRLTGTKEKRIIDLSEAVFDIYLGDYSGKDRQFKLIKSRVDKDLTAFNGSDGVNMGWKPAQIMNVDIVSHIKNSDIFGEEGLKNHRFIYRGLVRYNGKEAFLILFDQKEGIKKALYRGKIWLDADDLSFLELNISRSPRGLKYYDWGFWQRLMFKLSHVTGRILSDTVVVTYGKYGDKYYLNHVSTSSCFYLAGGNRHFLLDPLTIKTNYLISRIDTTNVQPFPKEEVMKNRGNVEQRSKTLNDTKDSPDRSDTSDRFWDNYNIIQAGFNVDSAIRVIQANNATLNLKKVLEPLLRRYPKDKILRIDSILTFYHRKEQFNGTALIQYDGKVIYEKGFGMADKERNIPNTGQTQFRIGSTSKQFTSMLIMQLVNEHRLSVEDTVGKFLPGYAHGQLTIQQLLTHQSGVPNLTEKEEYLGKIMTNKYSPDELVSRFCSDSLEFTPGTKFNYSNSGYIILADIIEKVTGQKYAVALDQRIFAPLGMKSSYFGAEGTGRGKLAKGYINGQPEIIYPLQNVIGAGAIVSTADDLLLWANALSANTLLPKEQMDELFRPRVEWPEWDAWYGYGWMIDRFAFDVSANHTVQYHPGTEAGFFDMLVRQPDKKIVLLLLNNTGDFPRFDMTDLVLTQLNQ
jgi:CubicO group peptidase (beta-lactamase class C family)